MAKLDKPAGSGDRADDYIRFLGDSPTPFHAVAECIKRLSAAGFVDRSATASLDVNAADKLFVVHPDGKSIVAVQVGNRSPAETGFAIVGAHTDSPDLRLRLNPLEDKAGTVLLNSQVHGGIIRRAWFDRPLALAGSLFQVLRDKTGRPRFSPLTGQPVVKRTLVHVNQPVAVIPELAIHLDRTKNDEGKVNAHTQLNAVMATNMDVDGAMQALSQLTRIPLDEVDGFDLHLVPWMRPQRVGVDGSMIVGARHDDLAMVYAGLSGLLEAAKARPDPSHSIVGAFFDAEETGSQTASGAASAFLRDVLVRLTRQHPKTRPQDDVEQALAASFVVSGDMAHALHPNHEDKHDSQHAPLINQGLVVKVNSNDRYASTGETTAVIKAICEVAGVPIQAFVNRQDMACGSTIGPITAARLGARTVDVGMAMWGMHSTAETMGAHDVGKAVDVMRCFYLGDAAR